MQSKRKLAPVVGRDGFSGSRGAAAGREQETPTVEIDATFGRSLGLNEGQKVFSPSLLCSGSSHVDLLQ